ncbi:MAG: DoxX family protein [Betaproteobacteria bacterium]
MITQRFPLNVTVKRYWQQIPDFSLSHILLRVPLALLFINQGLNKLPFDPSTGIGMGIPALVWWFVCYGEIAAGIGLLVGGIAALPKLADLAPIAVSGDLLTRFSGIVMCCITTGIIWTVIKPESLLTFIATDYLHFSLWTGGLYFALRGNWVVASMNKQVSTSSSSVR